MLDENREMVSAKVLSYTRPSAEKGTTSIEITKEDHDWLVENKAIVTTEHSQDGTLLAIYIDCGFRMGDSEYEDPDEFVMMMHNRRLPMSESEAVARMVEVAKKEIASGRERFDA